MRRNSHKLHLQAPCYISALVRHMLGRLVNSRQQLGACTSCVHRLQTRRQPVQGELCAHAQGGAMQSTAAVLHQAVYCKHGPVPVRALGQTSMAWPATSPGNNHNLVGFSTSP